MDDDSPGCDFILLSNDGVMMDQQPQTHKFSARNVHESDFSFNSVKERKKAKVQYHPRIFKEPSKKCSWLDYKTKKDIQQKEACIQRKRTTENGEKIETENNLNILDGVASSKSGFVGEKQQVVVAKGISPIPDLFSTGLIQSSVNLERDGSRSGYNILIPTVECGVLDYVHDTTSGDGPMMEDGMVEDAITSNENEGEDEDDPSDGMLLEDGRDGDDLVVAGNVIEASAYGGAVSAQPSPIDVKDCSTVMHTGDVTSDLGRLPSTRPTVNSDPAAKKHGMKGSLFNPINDNFSTLEKGLNIINCAPLLRTLMMKI
ncbi:hypothetical protein L2E82_44199 [Cichorium intybus]|uniref:Uncharacterized protein n=1 Tax=Cichorium intybus TaxID=13427 RepID=A0ACB8ZP04_CICIN|nr:hypothetical protein L2E82_44199 [Cichorium intybus]